MRQDLQIRNYSPETVKCYVRHVAAFAKHFGTETLLQIAADPKHLGARIGFLAVLHTWGQNLLHHPHIHCVVPGGGLSLDGPRWVSCRPGFFLPVKVPRRVFRGKFLERLRHAFDRRELSFFGALQGLAEPKAFDGWLRRATGGEWVVYVKPPMGGPKHVLEYLARYTHRTAISNQRLISLENDKVTFRWKDYRHGDRMRTMSWTPSSSSTDSCCTPCPRESCASGNTDSWRTACDRRSSRCAEHLSRNMTMTRMRVLRPRRRQITMARVRNRWMCAPSARKVGWFSWTRFSRCQSIAPAEFGFDHSIPRRERSWSRGFKSAAP